MTGSALMYIILASHLGHRRVKPHQRLLDYAAPHPVIVCIIAYMYALHRIVHGMHIVTYSCECKYSVQTCYLWKAFYSESKVSLIIKATTTSFLKFNPLYSRTVSRIGVYFRTFSVVVVVFVF